MLLPEADTAMIDRAATLCGWSRADFVRDAAVRAAKEVLVDNRPICMSPGGFADFMQILSAPATPAAEMVEVLQRSTPWEPGYVRKGDIGQR